MTQSFRDPAGVPLANKASKPRAPGLALAFAFGVLAFTGGCSAQSIVDTPLTRSVTDKLGVTTNPPQAEEFVRKTRPGESNYMPVGVVPPARETKPRTADEIKALESDLIGTRHRHDAASGRTPAEVKEAQAAKAKAAKAAAGAKAKPSPTSQ
jgi:hypothetical protein